MSSIEESDYLTDLINKITEYEKANNCRLTIDEIRETFYLNYETKFGIYDHTSHRGQRALASVAFHPLEDINKGSLLDSYIDLYLNCDIKNLYGETFQEFMNQPLDIIELKTEKAKDILNKKARQQEEVERKNKLILPDNLKF